MGSGTKPRMLQCGRINTHGRNMLAIDGPTGNGFRERRLEKLHLRAPDRAHKPVN